MLTQREEKFLAYWAANREKEKKSLRFLFIGLPIGFLIAIGIILSLMSGWYERATMVANSQFNPVVLIIAILGIVVFFGIFYKKYRWDMNEQSFKELQAKKKKAADANAAESSIPAS